MATLYSTNSGSESVAGMSCDPRVVKFLFEDSQQPLNWKFRCQREDKASGHKHILFRSIAFSLGGIVREDYDRKDDRDKGQVSVWTSPGKDERRLPVSLNEIWDDVRTYFEGDGDDELMFGTRDAKATIHLYCEDLPGCSRTKAPSSKGTRSRVRGEVTDVESFWTTFGPLNITFNQILKEYLDSDLATDEDKKTIDDAIVENKLSDKNDSFTLSTIARNMRQLAEVMDSRTSCKLDVTELRNAANATLDFIRGINTVLRDHHRAHHMQKVNKYMSDLNHRPSSARKERVEEYDMLINDTGYSASADDCSAKSVSVWMRMDGRVPAPNVAHAALADDEGSIAAHDSPSIMRSMTHVSCVSNERRRDRKRQGSARSTPTRTKAAKEPRLQNSPTSRSYQDLLIEINELKRAVYGNVQSKENVACETDGQQAGLDVREKDNTTTVNCSPPEVERRVTSDHKAGSDVEGAEEAVPAAEEEDSQSSEDSESDQKWPRYPDDWAVSDYHPSDLPKSPEWTWPDQLLQQCEEAACKEPIFYNCLLKACTISMYLSNVPKKSQKGKKYNDHIRKKLELEQLAASYADAMATFLDKASMYTKQKRRGANRSPERPRDTAEARDLNKLWSQIRTMCKALEKDWEMVNCEPVLRNWMDYKYPGLLTEVRDDYIVNIKALFSRQ